MKKLYFLLAALVASTIGFAQNSLVNFQAEIANRNGDVIYIRDNKKIIKEIKVDDKGVFKAAFDAKEGLYQMFDGVEYTDLFLKPGYDLKLKMDAKQFDESIKYTGKGAAENNYLAQYTVAESTYKYEEFLAADEANFNKMLEGKRSADYKKLDSAKLDPNFVTLEKQMMDASLLGLQQYYAKISANRKMNNSKAPNFDFENYAGGKTTLESLKGKYVYIDIWATWCGPCRGEIPFLKTVEEKYKGKNIEFVSIATDDIKDHEKWKTFVREKELGGIQLYAGKVSDFIKTFNVNTIPRFILIDPSGNIVDADAVRPSDPKLQEKLNTLLQ